MGDTELANIPDVSILIPVRNGEEYIAASLQSCLDQETTFDFEIVVVDDSSTDKTRQIVEQFALRNSNLRFFTNPKNGVGSALDFGLMNCKSELIARMDSDDLMMDGRIQTQVTFMKSNPAVAVYGSQIRTFGCVSDRSAPNIYPSSDEGICQFLARGNSFADPSVIFRRTLAIAVGGFKNYLNGAEQYDMWMRLSLCGLMANSDVALTRYRIHANQFTGRRVVRVLLATLIVQFFWFIGATRLLTLLRLRRNRCSNLRSRIPSSAIPFAAIEFVLHTVIRWIRK